MAGFEGTRVTDLLYAASHDAPPSQVDLGAALGAGRRRRRRRAVVTPVVVTVAVLGLAGGFVAAPWGRETGPTPPESLAPATPSPALSRTVAPAEFPLDRVLFAVDALGEPRLTRLSAGAQFLGYGGPVLWAFAAGADEARSTVEQEFESVDAPPVNGLAARWLYRDGGPGRELLGLSFQWAAGAWAAIIAGGPATEPVLTQLAASLRTGVDKPVRACFRVDPPDGLRLARAEPGSTGEEGSWSSQFFTLDDGPLPQLPPYNASGVEVTVGEYYDGPVDATTTIGGRPARVSDTDEYHSVELIETLGTTVRSVKVNVWGTARASFSAERAETLVLSVTVLC